MKIFHIADVHINYINGQYNEDVREKLQQARKTAFERAVTKAIELDVDLFIIAGDLLDDAELNQELKQFLILQANKLVKAKIITIICNGNHDPAENFRLNSIFNSSIIFDSENVQTYSCNTKSAENILVSGCGFSESTYYETPISKFPKRKSNQYHIGVAHATLGGVASSAHEPYMPIDKASIRDLNYNYFALGHIHKRQYFDDINTAYAGSIQGKNKKESGIKGGYFIKLNSPEDMPDVKFIPLSNIVFETIEQELSDKYKNFADLELEFSKIINSKIQNDMSEVDKNLEYQYVIDWKLKGSSSVYNLLQNDDIYGFIETLKKEFGFLELNINYDELDSDVNKDLHMEASPFLSMMNEVLNDNLKRDEFLNSICDKQFLDAPKNPVEKKNYLEEILDDVDDEWLYRLVTK